MSTWWVRLARYAQPHWRGLTLMLGLAFVGSAINALKPWPMKLLVDHVLIHKPLPENADWIGRLPGGTSPGTLVGWIAAATVLLFVTNRIVGIAQGYMRIGIGRRMIHALGADVFDHVQRLSYRFHNRHATGDLVRRVTADSACVRGLTMDVLLPVVAAALNLTMMSAVMWRLDRSLFLLAVVAAPLLVLLIRRLSKPMAERSYQQQVLSGEIMAVAEQTLTVLPVVQAFGREEHGDQRFQNLYQRSNQAGMQATRLQLQFQTATGAVTAVGTAVVMVVGGLHVLQGSLSVGALLVFLAYLSSLYAPLEVFAYASAGFSSGAAGARRVLEVLDAEERVEEVSGAAVLPARSARGAIRFEGVSFGYEPEQPVLRDVWLEANPGETVALVGPTGAGKSTLVSLIPRFFDPWQGRITLDGVDVRQIALRSLRAQISLVLQEPFLLPLSVAENIAYGRPDASPEEIRAAAAAACADDFIRRLPQGYDTVIGERGATLSGGQRQRLSIARALLKDAPVLILDEPTSALDARTEALLLEALERLMKGRTTFVIAHRLSTIRNASRIAVLEEGRIVETGTHAELLARSGVYAEFCQAQLAQPTTGAAA